MVFIDFFGILMKVFIFYISIGALTSKPYSFSQRPWELKIIETFDPMSVIYTPIALSVYNNRVKRVLPINDLVKNKNYNWISNKTRFFFEFLLEQKNEFSYYSTNNSLIFSRQFINNFYLINKISIKVSKLAESYKFWVFVRNMGFDLYTLQGIKEFSIWVRKIQIIPYIRNMRLNNWFSIYFGKFINSFTNTAFCRYEDLNNFKNFFLIGFNPYFLDPVLSFNISSKISNHHSSLSVYTFFFSGFSKFSSITNNTISNFKELESFFLGKHKWSKLISKIGSIMFIDYSFLISLPVNLLILAVKFISNFSRNIYVNGLKESRFANYFGKVFNRSYNNRFWNSKFFVNFLSNVDSKVVKFKAFSFLGLSYIADYKYIFGLNSLKFSYFSNPFDSEHDFSSNLNDEITNYSFFISSFLEFSGTYGTSFSLNNYSKKISDIVINPGPEKKPVFIFFKNIMNRVERSTVNNHYWNSKFYIYMYIIFFMFYGFFLFDWFFKDIKSIIYNIKVHFSRFLYSASSKVFNFFKDSGFTFDKSLGNYYFIQKRNYFGLIQLKISKDMSITNNYDQYQFGFFDDFQSYYSKTLILEKSFIVKRFLNFKLCYSIIYVYIIYKLI